MRKARQMIKNILSNFFPCLKKKSRYKKIDFEIDTYSEAYAELVENNKRMDASIEKSFEIMRKMNEQERLTQDELTHLGIIEIPKH